MDWDYTFGRFARGAMPLLLAAVGTAPIEPARPGPRAGARASCAALLLVLTATLAAGDQVPATSAPPLPEGAWRVAWLSHDAPPVWTAGSSHRVRLVVRNLGDTAWPDRARANPRASGDHAVRLGCRWECNAGDPGPSACGRARADLPAPLAPGDTVALVLDVEAPRTADSCRLVLDLVQENVAWFSSRGARTLALPARVTRSSGAGAGGLWTHAARVVALALLGLALLGWAGFAPAVALRSRRNASWLPLAVPAVGLAVLSAVGHALAALQSGTNWSTGPTLAVLGLLGGLAWRRGAARCQIRPALGLAWLAAGVGLALGLWPLIEVGELTTLGHTIDAIPYLAGAERLQLTGLARPAALTAEDPISQLRAGMVATSLRQGDQYFLATFASLTGLRPHRLFSVAMALWGTLLPLGVYVFARRGLGARAAPAALAALLAALHPLLHYVRLSDYFSQAAGLALFPFVALALWEAPRERSWRGWVLAGLLLGALGTLYPVYVVYLAPLGLAALLSPAARGRRAWAHAGARLAGVAIAAVALFPEGWWLAARALPLTASVARGGLGDLLQQGGMGAFAHPGQAFGLVNPLDLEASAATATHPVVSALLCAGLLLVGCGLAALRPRARLLALTLLATLLAGAAHQRFVLGFPYGYFKVLALLAPFLSALVALGLAAAWRRSRSWPTARAALGRCALLALAVGLAAVCLRQWRLPARDLAGPRLVADRAQLELEQVRALLSPDEPLLWLDTRWPGRAWDLYLLGQTANYDRDAPEAYAAVPEDRSARLIRHALRAGGPAAPQPRAGEPWWDPALHEVAWAGERFSLLRRRDGAVAELRFVHAYSRLPLRAPLVVSLEGRNLRLEGPDVPGGDASQPLEWPAQSLELALESARPWRLWVRQRDSHERFELPAGERTLSLPAWPRVELSAEPAEATPFVLGVKALAAPGQPG